MTRAKPLKLEIPANGGDSHRNGRVVAEPAVRERRRDRRYAIESELEYSLVRRGRIVAAGRGYTVDISSGGILFEASEPLPQGFSIAVVVPWPVRLGRTFALELDISGRIVRSEGNRTAVQIIHHEFCRKRARSKAAGQ